MNVIVKYFAKKYVASIVTDLIEAAAKKVDIDVWKARVKNVLDFCQLLLKTLDDNKLTPEEADKIVDAAKSHIK